MMMTMMMNAAGKNSTCFKHQKWQVKFRRKVSRISKKVGRFIFTRKFLYGVIMSRAWNSEMKQNSRAVWCCCAQEVKYWTK